MAALPQALAPDGESQQTRSDNASQVAPQTSTGSLNTAASTAPSASASNTATQALTNLASTTGSGSTHKLNATSNHDDAHNAKLETTAPEHTDQQAKKLSDSPNKDSAQPPDVNNKSSTDKRQDFQAYTEELRAAWPDLPRVTLEYRNLEYIVPVSVDTRPKNLLHAIASIGDKFKKSKLVDFHALRPSSGMIRPGSMTLILGPPGHGKSLFLKALAARLETDKNLTGSIRYNGLNYNEALAHQWHINKLTNYVDQVDVHISQLTVRETFEFAVANSVADVSYLAQDSTAQHKMTIHNKAQLMIELLGLTECSETIIGNDLLRGVSGGQKKRVTIGEMLCTQARILCLDEITNGLDSSAAFDVNCALRRWTRTLQGSVVTALLQPTPQTYELFDDVILMREGTVVYHGPRSEVIPHLAAQGIVAPPDQDDADFLVEFLSFPEAVYRKNRAKALRRSEQSRTGYVSHRTGSRNLAVPGQQRQQSTESQFSINPLQRAYSDAQSTNEQPQQHRQQSGDASAVQLNEVVFHEASGTSTHVPIRATSHDVQAQQQQQQKQQQQNGNGANGPPLTTAALERAYKQSQYYEASQHALAQTNELQGKPQGSFRAQHSPSQQHNNHNNNNSGAAHSAVVKNNNNELHSGQMQGNSHDASSLYTHMQYRRTYVHSIARHTALCLRRQIQLISRNKSFTGPKLFQAVFMGAVLGSLFWNLGTSDYRNRVGLLLFAPIFLAFGSMAEVPMSSEAKLVLYKQVDADFYPVMSYVFSVIAVHILIAIPETVIFGTIVYWMANFVHDAGHFFFFLLCLFVLSLAWSQFFRMLSYALPKAEMAQQLAGPLTAVNLLFAGFLITASKIPDWLIWAYYLSPFSWIVRSLALNEFKSARYSQIVSSGQTLGDQYLTLWQIDRDSRYKWAGIGYILAIFLLFVVFCIVSLTYQRFPLSTGTKRNAKQEEEDAEFARREEEELKIDMPQQANDGLAKPNMSRRSTTSGKGSFAAGALPFEPKDLTFKDLCYTIKLDSGKEKQLLSNVSGFARRGEAVALMGSSGAGKTTLMDVIAGRKTGGKITGQILLDGHPKEVKTFNRLCGYVEQTDIHLSGTTVREALMFSARLRLPSEVTREQRIAYVNEVLNLLELKDIQDRVISNESDGLSPGQMKRLTIGVEMASNPTILFLDERQFARTATMEHRTHTEPALLHSGLGVRIVCASHTSRFAAHDEKVIAPMRRMLLTPIVFKLCVFDCLVFKLLTATSGLTSREALLVMKVIKRVAQSGRTVLCTVHQPSSELFFQFDRLLLLRSGGRVVYFGDISEDGETLIDYFQQCKVPSDQPIPQIGEKDNPASWMLEVIGAGTAAKKQDAVDFAELYDASDARRENQQEIDELSTPKPGSSPLKFDSVYASSYTTQFLTVLSRMNTSYFRDTSYNLTRWAILLFQGILFGLLFYQINDSDQPGMQSKISAIFMAMGTTGVINCASALPVLYRNRAVFYRERASYTYTSFAYSINIGLIELPYILIGALMFNVPFYFLTGLRNDATIFFQFLLVAFVVSLCFNYYGQMLISCLPNILVAGILQGLSFTFLFLFGGVFITPPAIPKPWQWMYYLNFLPKAFIAAASNEFRCHSTPCPSIPVLPESGSGQPQQVDVEMYVGQFLDISFGKDFYWKWFGYLILTLVVLRIWISLALWKLNFLKR